MNAAETVRFVRQKYELTQVELARCLNVSLVAVKSWEGGSRTPTGSAIRLLQLLIKNDSTLTNLQSLKKNSLSTDLQVDRDKLMIMGVAFPTVSAYENAVGYFTSQINDGIVPSMFEVKQYAQKTQHASPVLYISGIHALNIPDATDKTAGDWHWGALNWHSFPLKDSSNSPLGNYGIRMNITVPHLSKEKRYNVAGHVRALLDMLIDGHFAEAEGMREDFIDNESLNPEIFAQVDRLRSLPNWPDIDHFMMHEYTFDWRKHNGHPSTINSRSARAQKANRAVSKLH